MIRMPDIGIDQKRTCTAFAVHVLKFCVVLKRFENRFVIFEVDGLFDS